MYMIGYTYLLQSIRRLHCYSVHITIEICCMAKILLLCIASKTWHGIIHDNNYVAMYVQPIAKRIAIGTSKNS